MSDTSGQLKTRQWARGITTTYGYDFSGRLTSTTHSDGTSPSISRTYWRNGQPKTITDGIGTHTYTPRQLHDQDKATWTLTGSTLLPNAGIEEGYDSYGRRQSWALSIGGDTLHRVGYGYDPQIGRLDSVALIGPDGQAQATWDYQFRADSAQIDRITAQTSGPGSPSLTAQRTYDALHRVSGISYSSAATARQGWTYGYDPKLTRRRTSARSTIAGHPGWTWGFDDRGQVTSAKRINNAGTAIAGQNWTWVYDTIGNRIKATRNGYLGVTLTTFSTTYTPNNVNQYSAINHPQALEINGLTEPTVQKVTINGKPTTGRPKPNGEPGGFSMWVKGTTAEPVWPQITIAATQTRAGAAPLLDSRSGHAYIRPDEVPTYDADGNLLSDAGWQYQWDADNRLILAQQKEPGLPADMPQKRIRYHYDWMSRLVAREESERRALPGTTIRSDAWTPVKTTHLYYDGWNLMCERSSSGVSPEPSGPGVSPAAITTRRYVHGLDLSNTHELGLANGPRATTTATGGVGALLGVIAPDDRLYSACTEVNGNITGFIEASTGALAARFDYDAFGNQVTDWSAPGHNAAEITQIRFSTKLQDPETGWLFYGYRWYDPVNGRWTAKDPIEEKGGINLYAMVGNDAVNRVDVLGQDFHHWFSQFGSNRGGMTLGQALIYLKFPDLCLDIDDYTTEIDGKVKGRRSWVGSPHQVLHHVAHYNELYMGVLTMSRSGCSFVKNMKTLMELMHRLLRVHHRLGDFHVGGYTSANLTLVRYRKPAQNNTQKYEELIRETCKKGDDGGELPIIVTLRRKVEDFESKSLSVSTGYPVGWGSPAVGKSVSGSCLGERKPASVGGGAGGVNPAYVIGGGIVIVGGAMLGAAAVADDATGVGILDDAVAAPAAGRLILWGEEIFSLGLGL